MTIVNSHEKKRRKNYYHYVMVKRRRNANIEEMDIELVQQEKNMDFEHCEEYWRSTSHQTKYYYDSVKKSKFSFSCHLQIDKKLNVKEDPMRKTESNFNFFQATKCLWGFKKKEYYAVHII